MGIMFFRNYCEMFFFPVLTFQTKHFFLFLGLVKRALQADRDITNSLTAASGGKLIQ